MSSENQGIEDDNGSVSSLSRSSSQASSLWQDSVTSAHGSEYSPPHPKSLGPRNRAAPDLSIASIPPASTAPAASTGEEASAEHITRHHKKTRRKSPQTENLWIAKMALVVSIFAIVVPIVVAVVALYFAHKDMLLAHDDAAAARTMAHDDAVAARTMAHDDAVAARATAHDDAVAARNLAHDSFRTSLMSSQNDAMGQLILAGFNLCFTYAEIKNSTFCSQLKPEKLNAINLNPVYKFDKKTAGVQFPKESTPHRKSTLEQKKPSKTWETSVMRTPFNNVSEIILNGQSSMCPGNEVVTKLKGVPSACSVSRDRTDQVM